MRRRDAQAIIFCAACVTAVFTVSFALSRSLVVSLPLTAACAAFVLTRPRIKRVRKRLRGAPDWSGYYKD